MSYSITIKAAGVGTPLLSGGSSLPGHMWYSLVDSNGTSYDYGWGPAQHNVADGPGRVSTNDSLNYLDRLGEWSFELSRSEFERVLAWSEVNKANNSFGSYRNYNGLFNSCVDFVWEAMRVSGATSNPTNGAVLPYGNRKIVLDEYYRHYSQAEYFREGRNVKPPSIWSRINDWWAQARTPTPRDPLAIDLDGDGIETTPVVVNGVPTLFDHDADGVRTGTGWLRPDDAWLVLDRNGNGSIDSGRELFGVDTVITVTEAGPNGGMHTVTRNARNGFEALKSLDTGNGTIGSSGHGDNLFNASDAQFAAVRVWRDLNGDGVSQAGELQSLAQAGIASISLNSTATNTNLGNGNTVTATATVTLANGSTTGVSGVNLSAGNLDLGGNPFYREFTDQIPWTRAAAGLPEMGGSGWLRDLREAVSLPTRQAPALQFALEAFAAANSSASQRSGLPAVLQAWAGTSGRANPWLIASSAGAYGSIPVAVRATVISETSTSRIYRYEANGAQVFAAGTMGQYVGVRFESANYYEDSIDGTGATVKVLTAEAKGILSRLGVLEAFNGARFVDFQVTVTNGGGGLGQGSGGGGGGSSYTPPAWTQIATISISDAQAQSLNQSYAALVDSVYPALALQTRLRPYLDSIDLIIGASGLSFDTSALQAMVGAAYTSDASKAVEDLVELVRYALPTLMAVGYDGLPILRTWVESWPAGSPLLAVATAVGLNYGAGTASTSLSGVLLGDAANNILNGGAGNDVIDSGAGNDTVATGSGDDALFGRDGTDSLIGGIGNDILDGVTGNDLLFGGNDSGGSWNGSNYYTGQGNDTYRFGRGDGQDTVWDVDSTASNLDTISLKPGVAPTDVRITRPAGSNNLVLSIIGTTDAITVANFFLSASFGIEQVSFDDGTVWDQPTILSRVNSPAGTMGWMDWDPGTTTSSALQLVSALAVFEAAAESGAMSQWERHQGWRTGELLMVAQ